MRIMVASDSFKDALAAREVCESLARGVMKSRPNWEVMEFPLADGGEGTMDVLIHHLGGERKEVEVSDPLGRPINAAYGLLDGGRIAMVEMAAASGIQLLKSHERDARKTTSYGTGQLILAALEDNPEHLIIGLGGSATNDGGLGMAAAFGYQLLDDAGQLVQPTGDNLGNIHSIDHSGRTFAPGDMPVTVICDVDNPMIGPRGASRTYGPQKGADQADVEFLENGMTQYAGLLSQVFGRDISSIPGAGSAGGMGAACLSYLGATLRPGVELVMELCQFEKELQRSDWVFTGEGRIDGQTLNGKLIRGICDLATLHSIPVVGFCGALKADHEMIQKIGLHGAFSIACGPGSLEDALANTAENLELASSQIAALIGGVGE